MGIEPSTSWMAGRNTYHYTTNPWYEGGAEVISGEGHPSRMPRGDLSYFPEDQVLFPGNIIISENNLSFGYHFWAFKRMLQTFCLARTPWTLHISTLMDSVLVWCDPLEWSGWVYVSIVLIVWNFIQSYCSNVAIFAVAVWNNGRNYYDYYCHNCLCKDDSSIILIC